MASLYVASWTRGAGKTTMCVGLGRWLSKNSKKVGYFKPVEDATESGDARFVKEALRLDEDAESLAPILIGLDDLKSEVAGGRLGDRVKRYFSEISSGKDVVLVEGVAGLSTDPSAADAASQTVEALDAQVIIVVACAKDVPWDRIAAEGRRFGSRLLGAVLNRVPQNRLEDARASAAATRGDGIRLLGVLPEDRALLGVSVAEIARHLQARPLCCEEGMSEMVENVMMGAMTPDSGADYFARKDNKAVIVRGERPDMQLAALATSTRCLILTGGGEPIGQVLSLAEDKGAPILVTDKDTLSAASDVEQAFVRARFQHQGKAPIVDRILEEGFDFSALSEGLKLAG
ncbi:MAG: hypothetical protein DRI40_05075 [Chloroflexi bacterium]|nr:MAG: hypothetical protein DRI40_05075 [Chloroflexota bacterium]